MSLTWWRPSHRTAKLRHLEINGAIHRDIPVHPIVEEIVEVVQVVLHERLQQRTSEPVVNASAPPVVDATSEHVRRRADAHHVHTPIPLTSPTKGNGAQ